HGITSRVAADGHTTQRISQQQTDEQRDVRITEEPNDRIHKAKQASKRTEADEQQRHQNRQEQNNQRQVISLGPLRISVAASTGSCLSELRVKLNFFIRLGLPVLGAQHHLHDEGGQYSSQWAQN